MLPNRIFHYIRLHYSCVIYVNKLIVWLQCALFCYKGLQINDVDIGMNISVISSPEYPSEYPNNADIAWILRTDWNRKIFITFTAFHTEESYDVVQVGDGEDSNNMPSRFLSWSGTRLPPDLLSNGSSMWIRLISDFSINHTGFSCQVTSIPANGKYFVRLEIGSSYIKYNVHNSI